jgi:hypothetical protein
MPTIPDFSRRPWQGGVSDPQLRASVLEGKGTLMPAFRGRISDEQARDLIAYIRALGAVRTTPGTSLAAPPVTDFEKRFRELEEQWDELERRLRELSELSKPPRKP